MPIKGFVFDGDYCYYKFLLLSIVVVLIPRLRSRPKLVYDQTQSSALLCVPRPTLQDLDGSSSALQSGRWSGDGLIRGQFGLASLIIGGFKRNWVWSGTISSAIFFSFFFYCEMLALPRGNNRAAFWSETHLKSNSSDQKKESSWDQRPVPFRGNSDKLETTMFLMESCLNSSIESEIYDQNRFRVHFSLIINGCKLNWVWP